MERQGRDMDRFHEMNKVKIENKISPYRYVISTEQFSRFGQLVKASSLSRTCLLYTSPSPRDRG